MKNWIRKAWDWFVGLIEKVPYDKLLHFVAGLIIAAFFNICFGVIPCAGLALLFGLLKELFDKYTTGSYDLWDAVATFIGGAVIQVFVLIPIIAGA